MVYNYKTYKTIMKYAKSEKGKLARLRARKKYNQSEKGKLYKTKLQRKLKLGVLTHYSSNPPHCACPNCYYHTHDCPIEFLTIDHINNDGAEQRRTLGKKVYTINFYYWLKRNNYPEGDYQVLCYNCNCGRDKNNGVCPHKNKNECE